MENSAVDQLRKLYQENSEQFLRDFFTFLRFESVSSEEQYKPQLLECATWLSAYLSETGFVVESWDTEQHPVIYASWMNAGPDKPTVLIYNHYDVQPVDPVALWKSAPFEPTVRDGEIYCRGAQDNKGQCFYTIAALRAMLQTYGSLPVNVKLIIEGEEEIGSSGLAALLERKKSELQAEHLLVVDLGLRQKDQPSLTLGLRGMVALTIECKGSFTDLHSGIFGGVAYNPNRALVELLGSCWDEEGRIAIPGFYDDVAELDQEELRKISFEFSEEEYEQTIGGKPKGGEKRYSALESAWIRPSLELNGIAGGYSGSGFKTVIPAQAVAKLSARIVPNQDPVKIGHLIKDYLESKAPEGVTLEVQVHAGGGKPIRTTSDSGVVQAAAKAYEEVLGKPCKYVLEGASIPIATDLAVASGAEVVLLGYGLHDDQIHAPNEHFGLDRLEKGFITIARILQILGS